MSSELLRRAAKVLREKAANAIPGQWESLDAGDRLIAFQGDDDELFEYLVTEEPARHGETADYIALMHPPVALALADLLESLEEEGGAIEDSTTEEAIMVARAILLREGP